MENFLFFYLYSPLLTFIDLYWNGSKKGVFGGKRRVGGGALTGHKGHIGSEGRTARSPGTVPHAARSGARGRLICATALI
jgi:hypothetical protein